MKAGHQLASAKCTSSILYVGFANHTCGRKLEYPTTYKQHTKFQAPQWQVDCTAIFRLYTPHDKNVNFTLRDITHCWKYKATELDWVKHCLPVLPFWDCSIHNDLVIDSFNDPYVMWGVQSDVGEQILAKHINPLSAKSHKSGPNDKLIFMLQLNTQNH